MRIERTAASHADFSLIGDGLPIDFAGSGVELRAFLRTADVQGDTELFLREDDDDTAVQFANIEDAKLHGTTEWTEYSVKLPLDRTAKQLAWGVVLSGSGTAWVDDLQLLVDGKPIWDAPSGVRDAPPSLDRDLDGTGIAVASLSPLQIDNLVALGKVWGFLKYHHPKVTAGKLAWDAELVRVLPATLAAPDRATANAALVRWIDELGPLAPCAPCASLDEHDVAVRPDLAWLDDPALGAELSARLHAVYAARVPRQQHYVALAPGVRNPVFRNEPASAAAKLPDAGVQLLALFRLWSTVEYWAPDRMLADPWGDQLAQLVPSVMLASTANDFKLAMIDAISRLHDTHANLWSSLDVRPPVGECDVPIDVRFIGARPVVATADPDRQLAAGDVITSLDGAPIADLVARWRPHYAASNEAAQLRDLGRSLLRGACGPVAIGVDRGGARLQRTLARVANAPPKAHAHDRAGPTFQRLAPDVAYLKLSTIKVADIPHYIEQAAGTTGLIVDIRNYPGEFVVYALGSLLVDRSTPFVRFTTGDLSTPGAFHWAAEAIQLDPDAPHYGGKVAVLVDEMTQSQAEFTAMALRAGPHTVIVGSTTAGADGNVSELALPGGLTMMLSGIGVFYPDKRPTQRIGIVPDVVVTPTIAGLRAGRDEVLDAGIRAIRSPAKAAAKARQSAP